MDETELQKLTRQEDRAKGIVAHIATDLLDAEERVERLKKQLKASTQELSDIRKELTTKIAANQF